jgi:hypothetical protein
MKQERKYTNCICNICKGSGVVVVVVHCKNQIQIQASKQEIKENVLCDIYKVLLLLLLLIAKNKSKSKSKQARKHTIVLCEIGKVLLFVVAHCKNQIHIEASKKTHNCAL